MTRIFLPPEELTTERITITGDNARHLVLVLRIQPGEEIIILDGQGFRYECIAESVHKKEVVAKCISKAPYSVESPIEITLVQGLPKGDRMDLIVQKATELGARRIVPLVTERSQVRHTHKLERWRKIARSASEQSGRDRVPDIEEPSSLNVFLAAHPCSGVTGARYGIVFSEGLKERNLKTVLSGMKNTREVVVLVGPEGGLSADEADAAVRHGFREVSLGPRILRAETAPLAALSIIQYELGDMG